MVCVIVFPASHIIILATVSALRYCHTHSSKTILITRVGCAVAASILSTRVFLFPTNPTRDKFFAPNFQYTIMFFAAKLIAVAPAYQIVLLFEIILIINCRKIFALTVFQK